MGNALFQTRLHVLLCLVDTNQPAAETSVSMVPWFTRGRTFLEWLNIFAIVGSYAPAVGCSFQGICWYHFGTSRQEYSEHRFPRHHIPRSHFNPTLGKVIVTSWYMHNTANFLESSLAGLCVQHTQTPASYKIIFVAVLRCRLAWRKRWGKSAVTGKRIQ